MKKLIFLFAFFILFKPLVAIVEYMINYEYISTVLCENKEKPILGCNGKCYLMNQLAKSADGEQPVSDKKVVIKDVEVLFFQELESVSFLNLANFKILSFNCDYSNKYSFLNSRSLFRPPIFIS